MELEQRENPAGALCELKHENLDQNFSEKVEDCVYQCKHKDMSEESKTEETEAVCEVLEQQQEKDEYRKQPDELDPRIQEELEHLNEASEEINQLELQLEEERSSYRKILSESVRKLNALSSQLGSCIEKARPYYEARRLAKEAQQETQKAALSYERAVSMHTAAREMVYVAEQGLGAHKTLDQTWQEMLNHATAKINEAEQERLRSEREHMRVTQQCQAAEAHVQDLQKSLKRTIMKSKPYFELKSQLNFMLETHKLKVNQLEEHVTEAKKRYSSTLQSLEKISEEIHAQRGQDHSEDGSTKSFGARSPPVGAEAVISTETARGQYEVLTTSNDKVDGQEAKTQEWVERHRESGWWEREKERPASVVGVGSDSNSVFSLKTIASDLEKYDSVEHLGQLSDSISFSEEEDEKVKNGEDKRRGAEQVNELNMDLAGNDSQEQLMKQHHRSVSL